MKNRTVVLAIASIFCWNASLSAEHGAWQACEEDRERLCKDVEPGGGRIIECMLKNEASLSEGCREHMAQKKKHFNAAQKMHDACGGDVERFCKNVEPGGGRLMECLKEHKDELSPACREMKFRAKAYMKEHKKERMAAVEDACRGDVNEFCKDVEPGDGRIMHCLKDHKSELSEGCRNAFHHKHKGHGKHGKHKGGYHEGDKHRHHDDKHHHHDKHHHDD